jgi:hypothetical protein
MAHYYFDLKNGATERDHAGMELDNDAAAIARARAIADELSLRLLANDEHQRHVCIIHEDGHEVMRVRVENPAAQPSASRLKKFSQ